MKDLDYYLENICVEFPLEFPPTHAFADLTDWYGVSNENGIIAYFGKEVDALRFRLDYINSIMNPIKKRFNILNYEQNRRNTIKILS